MHQQIYFEQNPHGWRRQTSMDKRSEHPHFSSGLCHVTGGVTQGAMLHVATSVFSLVKFQFLNPVINKPEFKAVAVSYLD